MRTVLIPRLGALLGAALLAGCASAPSFTYTRPDQPEAASGYTAKPGWTHQHFAVAAANPLATDAGFQILKAGGSAIDAAIAVQMVLALVEPQSSGIGGGAFLMYFNGQDVAAYDGRETAPAAATEALFLGKDGKPMAFDEAKVGGRSVGTPGTVAMLEMAHAEHGKLPWATLFAPAIQLAEQGFKVSPRLNTMLGKDKFIARDPAARAYFFDAEGRPWPVGHVLKNPELAAVLRTIAQRGATGLLEGEVARAIVDKVGAHPTNPGLLTLSDLANYKAKRRDPMCHDHRGLGTDYRICGFPPPSSGAIAVGQILGILGHTETRTTSLETGATEPPADMASAEWLHRYVEASRLTFADRAQYLADPDFVAAPGGSWASLLDPAYLAERSRLIGQMAMPDAPAGTPGPMKTSYAPMPDQPEYGTSHISIVDANGHAVAMTTTIEDAFGARQMVKGFLLNNELTDFSFAPRAAGGSPIANRVEPGKRPRSSMAPTLVFDKTTGKLVMSGGSPGGALIIHYTAKTLYGTLNRGLTPQQAIDLPNFASVGGKVPVLLEAGRFDARTIDGLKARGHQVKEMDMTSGLQAIRVEGDGSKQRLLGGADPRREGVVMGE
ncbi:gamma-glutamyltransferase family protein [Denitromonas halophila]|uniref:Gamma-glutamyltransferase family protein n=1 Tax=Denitromonas halophila TaxID=1629404 RepID=A0A557QWK1_9RHOO|nr:gamma-glutamyltransferase family protein [Denitromonas halophila]TVO57287.1 gamma-glutamyltransferase family protein [Denitromonas halophila]